MGDSHEVLAEVYKDGSFKVIKHYSSRIYGYDAIGLYVNGLMKVEVFHNNGQLEYSQNFTRGEKRTGRTKYFDENGDIIKIESYKDDIPIGEWLYFSDNEYLSKIDVYNDGELYETYYPTKKNTGILNGEYIDRASRGSILVFNSDSSFKKIDGKSKKIDSEGKWYFEDNTICFLPGENSPRSLMPGGQECYPYKLVNDVLIMGYRPDRPELIKTYRK